MECYHADKRFLEAFSGHYMWWYHHRYTGQKSELTLKEILRKVLNLKNWIEKKSILSFFITFVNSLWLVDWLICTEKNVTA